MCEKSKNDNADIDEKLKGYIERIEKMQKILLTRCNFIKSFSEDTFESSTIISGIDYFRNQKSSCSSSQDCFDIFDIRDKQNDFKRRKSSNSKFKTPSEKKKRIQCEKNSHQTKSQCLLFQLPVEVLFDIFEFLTSIEWKMLERTCQQLRSLSMKKYADIVEIDIYKDYIEPTPKKKLRKQRNFADLIVFMGNRFTALESLILSGCNFNVDCPDLLSGLGAALPNLKRMEMIREWPNCNGPVVRNRALDGFNKNFVKLETLILDGSIVPEPQVKRQFRICNDALPNLIVFSLRLCFINLDFLQVNSFNRLTVLNVESSFSYDPLPSLVHFTSISQTLTEINVSHLGIFDDDALNLLQNLLRLTNLRVLEMGGYEDIETVVPLDVQLSCTNLEAFLVPQSFFVHYNLLRSVCQFCTKLISINLSNLNDFIDEEFQILACCKNLVDINLSGTMVSDDVIEYLTARMPQISELNLRICKQLTDNSMRSLAMNSKNLRKLYLFKKSRAISANSIQYLVDRCQTLQYLEVSRAIIAKLKVPETSNLELCSVAYV